MNRRGAERIAFAIAFASALWFSVPPLVDACRLAWSVRHLRHDERRAHIFGPLYRSIIEIRKRVPATAPVAIVLRRQADADLGIYVNYFLFPHPTRMYFGVEAYRADPSASRTIAYIDRDRAWEAKLISPEALP